jgi:hypothetical protein
MRSSEQPDADAAWLGGRGRRFADNDSVALFQLTADDFRAAIVGDAKLDRRWPDFPAIDHIDPTVSDIACFPAALALAAATQPSSIGIRLF